MELSESGGGGGGIDGGANEGPPPPPVVAGGGGGAPPSAAATAPSASQRMNYSIPGILHFIQHEWARFEMERSQWEVEKAELQARIAFLQGERKGQENLKNDLVRRIKMLEYALKQERAKYNKLKSGKEEEVIKPPNVEEEMPPPLDGENYIAVSNVNWRQGKQLLRQYLNEIGYTDTIIDVRSNRIRSVLGLHDNEDSNRINGSGDTRSAAGQRRPVAGSAGNDDMMMDSESAVMANFDFLKQEVEGDEDENMDDETDGLNQDIKIKVKEKDTEEALNEFNFITSASTSATNTTTPNKDSEESNSEHRINTEESSDWGLSSNSYPRFSSSGGRQTIPLVPPSTNNVGSTSPNTTTGDRELMGANLELGELEQLTITNDNESSYDISAPKEAFRKTWNAKYTLRSHFDGVRALCFHPSEPVLITASEDQTLKMWNLQKTIPAKKSPALDVEPVYTFRAHRGPVLSLDVSQSGDLCFSGGLDSSIRVWNMPCPNVDPYDSYDTSVLAASLLGHTDAVWGVSYHSSKKQLLSCSADGTVKLWSPLGAKTPLLNTFGSENNGVPTSVDWVYENSSCMVTAYNNAACVIYDLETGKPVIKLDTTQDNDVGAITRVVSHPTLPLTITAHEDRHIRFFDNSTGKLTHSMVAHLEAVTSLAIDANGLYLISGSHDCSVRLWNLETKTCVQEITAHRKKFDESIFDVAFHPTKPYIASAGADALAKVFV